MNRYDEHPDSSGRRLDEELRSVLAGADELSFDHDALVAGTKARAGRLRRRQAVARGVAAVVLVPTLAGAGWVMSSTLTGGEGSTIDVASQTSNDDAVPTTEADDPVPQTEGPAPTADAEGTEDAEVTTAEAGPPYQDPTLLAPITLEPPNRDWPNRWTVPDARPTGVAFLDALGAPQPTSQYPRQVPLMDFMMADENGGGVEPHSGLSQYFYADGNAIDQNTVSLDVTAWDDSRAVLADLRIGGSLSLSRWADGTPRPVEWPGHADADHLLVVDTDAGGDWPVAGALVRQGDYLVGVTARAQTWEEAVAAATEIALKAAANLSALDPEHANG